MQICAYSADVIGMRRQARGLADAISAVAKDANAKPKITEYYTSNSAFHKTLPTIASFFVAKVLPKPDMLVACGGASAAGALQQKRRGVFVVYVQKPPISPSAFDVVVCGTHDYPHKPHFDNIITIAGSVGGISYPMLAQRKQKAAQKFATMPRPHTALIIGGDNRAYSLTPDLCRRFACEVAAADCRGSVLIVSSRRTSAQCRAVLSAAAASVANAGRVYYADNQTDNAEDYADILAAADRAIVSGDSVNMISEAACAQIPVYILPLATKRKAAADKFGAFHAQMVRRGAAVIWRGQFADFANVKIAPFDETARAAKLIWQRYLAAVC